MESLESFHAHINNIQHQAGMLAETTIALSKSFKTEADRLTREDGSRRLQALRTAVLEESQRLRRIEDEASRRHAETNLPFLVVDSMAKLIVAVATENQRARNFVNNVFTESNKKTPYGMVMVCIGVKGLPDDVEVVSISGLARDSKRLESEVIYKLQQASFLLFSEQAFASFVDKLIVEIREGWLHLPLTSEKLSEIADSYCLAIHTKQSKWVLISRPQRPTSIFRSE